MSTRIEWAHETVNPLGGCFRVSPACNNCYAVRMAHRHGGNPKLPHYHGLTTYKQYVGPKWTGEIRWFPGVLEKSLLRLMSVRANLRIFVGSMTDIAHENATVQHLANVLAFAAALPQHTIMLCTKRPELLRDRMAALRGPNFADVWDAARKPLYDACRKAYSMGGRSKKPAQALLHKAEYIGMMCADMRWPLRNVWLGTTIWDQASADRAVPILLNTPAAKRFVSVEPMLGPVDLPSCIPGEPCPGCCDSSECAAMPDWVICGGETGPGARPMHPDWPRSLRDQCTSAGVPFFFKQWGEYGEREVPGTHSVYCHARRNFIENEPIGHEWNPDGKFMIKCGKAAAGRVLDGRTWEEVPA